MHGIKKWWQVKRKSHKKIIRWINWTDKPCFAFRRVMIIHSQTLYSPITTSRNLKASLNLAILAFHDSTNFKKKLPNKKRSSFPLQSVNNTQAPSQSNKNIKTIKQLHTIFSNLWHFVLFHGFNLPWRHLGNDLWPLTSTAGENVSPVRGCCWVLF